MQYAKYINMSQFLYQLSEIDAIITPILWMRKCELIKTGLRTHC